ncbi:hypothetical protein AWB80_01822 [Caballeronia pedi]|uniref:Uncharacterized protein n=1 Tax=Caballeronia pedi TaxID=1777141 RepID=A0A158A5M7_9BURK|nr:hypothetical protein AWB80_01822 [Caballeronia pedi]
MLGAPLTFQQDIEAKFHELFESNFVLCGYAFAPNTFALSVLSKSVLINQDGLTWTHSICVPSPIRKARFASAAARR